MAMFGGIRLIDFLKLFRYPDDEFVEVYGLEEDFDIAEELCVSELLQRKGPCMNYIVDHIMTGTDPLKPIKIALRQPKFF